jgi:hypothetical protein
MAGSVRNCKRIWKKRSESTQGHSRHVPKESEESHEKSPEPVSRPRFESSNSRIRPRCNLYYSYNVVMNQSQYTMWHMRRGNSMQEARHAQIGCARGRRKVTYVSRSQTGRYVRVFASFRLLVHVSAWSFDCLLAYWHASSCVVAQVETQPQIVRCMLSVFW